MMREVERRELEFPCSFCGVEAGEWCVVVNGRHGGLGTPAPYLHAARFYAARAAGRLPLGSVSDAT